jgi:hypothetical protein
MSKKADAKEPTVDELRAQLKAEQERSDRLQKENEDRQRREDERIRREKEDLDRARATTAQAEPSEEQWVKLEEEYGMDRAAIRNTWKLAQRVAAPLAAELNAYKTKDAASDAVRAAKAAAASNDAQFPKYEAHVDEYLSDLSVAEKSDPTRMAKHMERAVLYAQGKARKQGSFRDTEDHDTIKDGMTQEQRDDVKAGFGVMEIQGMPLTIDVEKRVPDDYRKLNADTQREGAVRMNERSKWSAGVPVKPR